MRRLLIVLEVLASSMLFTAAAAADSVLTEFLIPTPSSSPYAITAGPDGNLWIAEHFQNKIARMTPVGQFTEFSLPPFRRPGGVAAGPDGRIWFTESDLSEVGVLRVDGHFDGEYFCSKTGVAAHPLSIIAAGDGRLWFTNSDASSIASIRPDGTGLSEYVTPSAHSFPRYIAEGPGGSIWFTEEASRNVARLDREGTITEWNVPDPSAELVGITRGPDGNIWFVVASVHSKIGRLKPSTGQITYFDLPRTHAQAREIITGPDGQLWYTDSGSNAIGRISASGVFSAYGLPSDPLRGLTALTVGPDGAVFFTEIATNMVGRLSPEAFARPVASPRSIPTLSSTLLKLFAATLGAAGLRALR